MEHVSSSSALPVVSVRLPRPRMPEQTIKVILLLSNIIACRKWLRRAEVDPEEEKRFEEAWKKVAAKTEAFRNGKF